MTFLFQLLDTSHRGNRPLLPFKTRCEYPLMAFVSMLPVILFHAVVIWWLFVSVTKNVNKKPEVIEVSMMSVSNSQEKQEAQPKQAQPPPPPPKPVQPQKEAMKPKPVVKKVQPIKPPVPIKKIIEEHDVPVMKEVAPVDNTPPAPSPPPSSAPVSKTVETPPPRQKSSGISPLFHVLPKYPQHAANAHIEGWVRVEFTIQTDGTVDDAVVVSSQPPDVFDDAALTAIRKWEFKEKIVNGVPVTQRATQTLQFKLEN